MPAFSTNSVGVPSTQDSSSSSYPSPSQPPARATSIPASARARVLFCMVEIRDPSPIVPGFFHPERRMSGMRLRYLGYGGLILILVALCFLIVSFQEMRFESTVARHKGTVIGKDIQYDKRSTLYRVRYRVTIQSRTI